MTTRNPSRKTSINCLLASTACFVTLHGSALAEEREKPSFEEIIVTANKRDQSINDVSMSVTALSGATLDKRGISDASELMMVVPGFTYTKTHDSIPVFSIRGVGYYDNSLGATPAVSAYVDEVPLPYPVLTKGVTLDLERVEALKGPQGTLFGQNATGGALNFIAGKPQDTMEGRVSLGYGRFNAIEASGYVTGPLSDNLNARLGVKYENSSDWQKSSTHDETLGSVNRGAGRLSLDWTPIESLNMLLAVEGWFDKSDSQAAQLRGLSLNIPGFQNPALATGDGSPGNPITQVYGNASQNAREADWSPGKDYQSDHKYIRTSLRTTYDVNEDILLTSITAYQHLNYVGRVDADGTTLEIADLTTDAEIESFYQELRISGQTGELSWMVGGNYADDSVVSVNEPNFRDWSVPIGDLHIITRNKSETIAGFFNLEYALTETITLQGGGRYTQQDQNMSGCPSDSGNGIASSVLNFLRGTDNLVPGGCYSLNDLDGSFAPAEANVDLKENNFSWRTGINYQMNDDTLLYANISKGYKAGAFTLAVFDLVSQAAPATQESILAYEVGFKMGTPTLQLNGAGFYYDYKDKQLLAPFDTGGPFGVLDKLQNIPKSRILGAEFEAVWAPVDGLRMSVNGTFIDSEITSSFIAADPSGTSVDLKGESFIYTPRWGLMGDLEYGFDLANGVYASLGASISYRGSTTARFAGGPEYIINSYALLDLRASIEMDDGEYAIDLWMNNVTDKYYTVNNTSFIDTIVTFAGQPRTFGIRGRVNF